MRPEECPLCWRFDCQCWKPLAIADRSPKGRDKGTLGSVHESGGAGTAIALTHPKEADS
jgi:hypothetical protein